MQFSSNQSGMSLLLATHRLFNFAMYPIPCAKVDVRTHFRKGYMQRGLAIHHFSQKHRRQHTVPLFSRVAPSCRTTRHSPFLAPSDATPHSALRTPSKSLSRPWTDSDTGIAQQPLSTSCCAPHLHRGATESPSLWSRPTAPVTPSSVARLPRACHTP